VQRAGEKAGKTKAPSPSLKTKKETQLQETPSSSGKDLFGRLERRKKKSRCTDSRPEKVYKTGADRRAHGDQAKPTNPAKRKDPAHHDLNETLE